MAQSCNSLVYSAAQLVVSATDQKVGGLVPGSHLLAPHSSGFIDVQLSNNSFSNRINKVV